MKKVAFVCVHNSCRSQMAETLGNLFARDILRATQQVQKPNL